MQYRQRYNRMLFAKCGKQARGLLTAQDLQYINQCK